MRCASCKKKVGSVSFTCLCEHSFCVACRLPEVHACPVKRDEKVVLPKVVAAKVEKI